MCEGGGVYCLYLYTSKLNYVKECGLWLHASFIMCEGGNVYMIYILIYTQVS